MDLCLFEVNLVLEQANSRAARTTMKRKKKEGNREKQENGNNPPKERHQTIKQRKYP